MASVIIFVFIVDYYMEAIAVNRLDMSQASRVASMATFSWALLLSCVWTHPFVSQVTSMGKIKEILAEDHMLSGGVIFSFILFLFGKWYTVWLLYYTVMFLEIRHKKHPIAHPDGGAMECLCWYIVRSISSTRHFHVIYNNVLWFNSLSPSDAHMHR